MNWDIELVAKAWNTATTHHDGQKYGGPANGQYIEYLNHIGRVALEVINALQYEPSANPNLAIVCAILHDTLEDTQLTEDEVRSLFGDSITEGVRALTKNAMLITKEAMMADSLARILRQPKEVAMVKLADRICNLSAPPYYWDDAKKKKYAAEAQTIHDALAFASDYLGQRLAEKIKDYDKFLAPAN